MKVLIAATHLNKGGIAFYTVNLARKLKRLGVFPTVLSSGGELTGILREDGIPHIEQSIHTKSEFGFKVLRALPGTAREVRKGGFDLVHAQTRVTQAMAGAIAAVTGVPYVTTCHGFFKHKRLARRLFPLWGEKVIAISKSVKEHLISDMKVPEEKVELVYNGVDLELYSNASFGKRAEVLEDVGIDGNSLVIGAVGRFSSVKGFKYLIEAFEMTASKRHGMSLLFVGQGPEEEKLKKQAALSAFSDKIFFISAGRSLAEYLSVIDIFCMPSLNEGFGLAVVEAMAMGKVCIVSGVGGLTEIVTDGRNGIVVKPESPEELAEAIYRISGDPELSGKISEAAKKRASDFSLEKCAEGTLAVYRSVLKERSVGELKKR